MVRKHMLPGTRQTHLRNIRFDIDPCCTAFRLNACKWDIKAWHARANVKILNAWQGPDGQGRPHAHKNMCTPLGEGALYMTNAKWGPTEHLICPFDSEQTSSCSMAGLATKALRRPLAPHAFEKALQDIGNVPA
jgi:hypothetical protein